MSMNVNFNPEFGKNDVNSIRKQIPNEELSSIFSANATSDASKLSQISKEVEPIVDLTKDVKIEQEYNKDGKLVSTLHYNKGETEPFMKTSFDASGKITKKEMFDPPITTEFFYEGDVLVREEEDWGTNIVTDKRTGASADMGSEHITREYSVEQGYTGKESFMDKQPIRETLTTNDGKYKQVTEYIDGKEIQTIYRPDEQGNWIPEKASENK